LAARKCYNVVEVGKRYAIDIGMIEIVEYEENGVLVIEAGEANIDLAISACVGYCVFVLVIMFIVLGGI
jgi:hypothetical protein